MPNLINLKSLFKFETNLHKSLILKNGSIQKKDTEEKPTESGSDYFLFMLGTDTCYTPLPTKDSEDESIRKSYENGETLSYVAQVVAEQLGEKPQVYSSKESLEPWPFRSPSVDLVNGPTTIGSEVGQRIALALALILNALANGKTDIIIPAHSRGAVETILVMHELDRIKKALKNSSDKSVYDIILDSPCPYTKKALPGIFEKIQNEENTSERNSLSKCLDEAKIHPFLIDPVPGGSYVGLSLTAWRNEPRFYKELPCTTSELILLSDERTRCFIPIVPVGQTPLNLRGHHGSFSGGIYDQAGKEIPVNIKNRDTSSIQQLGVCKLLNFINKNSKAFNNPKSIDLKHPKLDNVTNQFINNNDSQKSQQLLGLYDNLVKNSEAFDHFAKNTSYGIGREESNTGNRIIHYGAHNYIGLDTIVPQLNGIFINTEHARLELHKMMNFSSDKHNNQLGLLIDELSSSVNNLFKNFVNGNEKTKELLDNSNRDRTFKAISIFIDNISQKYLRNHLTLEEKKQLLTSINKFFNMISSYTKEYDSKLFPEFNQLLQSSIQSITNTHYSSLLEQSNKLNNQLIAHLDPNKSFEVHYSNFLKKINPENKDSLAPELMEQLDKITEVTPSVFDELLSNYLNTNGSEKTTVKQLSVDISNYLETSLSDEELFKNLERLHENLQSLSKSKDLLQELVGKQQLSIDVDLLSLHADRVIKLGASILVKNKNDLNEKPEFMSDQFFKEIKNQAIALGASNPEYLKIQNSYEELNEELKKVASLNINLKEDNILQKNNYEQQKIVCDKLQQETTELRTEKKILDNLITKKDELFLNLDKQYKSDMSNMEHQISSEKKKIDDLTNEVNLEKHNTSDLIIENKKLHKTINELQKTNRNLTYSTKIKDEEYSKNLLDKESLIKFYTDKIKEQSIKIEKLEDNQNNILIEQQKLKDLIDDKEKSMILIEEEHRNSLLNKEHQINELENKIKSQSTQINTLENNHNDLLKEQQKLTQFIKDKEKLILLTQEKHQSTLLNKESQITDQKNEIKKQSIVIENLENQKNDLQIEQEKLLNSLDNKDTIILEHTNALLNNESKINEQKNKIKEQSVIIENLKSNNLLALEKITVDTDKQLLDLSKQHEIVLSDKDSQINQQQVKIQDLEQQIKEKNDLDSSIREKNDLINNLKMDNKNSLLTKDLIIEKQKDLIKQLNTEKELTCLNLINAKLIPLSQEYCEHLIAKAKKLNSSKTFTLDQMALPDFDGDELNRIAYNKIATKYALAHMLLSTLKNTDVHPLPSERVIEFTKSLKNSNKALGEHRNSGWIKFSKGCLAAIAIICTGIIPGLITLLAYSAAKGKSPLFFTQSHGKQYEQKMENITKHAPTA